jgi:hypothetical protein
VCVHFEFFSGQSNISERSQDRTHIAHSKVLHTGRLKPYSKILGSPAKKFAGDENSSLFFVSVSDEAKKIFEMLPLLSSGKQE